MENGWGSIEKIPLGQIDRNLWTRFFIRRRGYRYVCMNSLSLLSRNPFLCDIIFLVHYFLIFERDFSIFRTFKLYVDYSLIFRLQKLIFFWSISLITYELGKEFALSTSGHFFKLAREEQLTDLLNYLGLIFYFPSQRT